MSLLKKLLVVVAVSGLLFSGMLFVSQSGFLSTNSLSINSLSIRNVRVDGLFKHVSQEQLKNKISNHISGGFFGVDVFKIENKVEEIAWVKSASVRRIWPNTLAITIQEQQAIAIWNKDSLLNAQGEIFDVVTFDEVTFDKVVKGIADELPHLRGPDGSHSMMLSQYKEMVEEIRNIGKRISVLQMDDRHAWRIVLDDGIELRLGRNNIHAALRRFTKVVESSFSSNIFSKNMNNIAHVDLRYTNGFAVKWKPKQVSLLQNRLLESTVSLSKTSLNNVSLNNVSLSKVDSLRRNN